MSGAFDPRYLPYLSVEVCLWKDDSCQGQPVARFTASNGKSPERLRIGEDGQKYILNWQSWASALQPSKLYHLRVIAGPAELGYVELSMSTRGVLQNASTGATIAPKGTTLPVKFAIQDDLAGAGLIGQDGGVINADGYGATLVVPPGAVQDLVVLAISADDPPVTRPDMPSPFLGKVVSLLPNGQQFAVPVQLELPISPGTEHPELLSFAQYLPDDELLVFREATFLAAQGAVRADLEHFSKFALVYIIAIDFTPKLSSSLQRPYKVSLRRCPPITTTTSCDAFNRDISRATTMWSFWLTGSGVSLTQGDVGDIGSDIWVDFAPSSQIKAAGRAMFDLNHWKMLILLASDATWYPTEQSTYALGGRSDYNNLEAVLDHELGHYLGFGAQYDGMTEDKAASGDYRIMAYRQSRTVSPAAMGCGELKDLANKYYKMLPNDLGTRCPVEMVPTPSVPGQWPAGTVMDPSPGVQVKDAVGHPVPYVTVVFGIESGFGGSVDRTVTTTDDTGGAYTQGWRVASTDGAPSRLEALVRLLPPYYAFWLTHSISQSGFLETFSDGNFTSNPTWTPSYPPAGTPVLDASSGALHLSRSNGFGSGQTLDISTPVSIPVTSTTAINFDIKIAFSDVANGCGFICTEYPGMIVLELDLAGGGSEDLWLAYNYRGGLTQIYPGGVGYSGGPIQIIARGDAPQGQWLQAEHHVIQHHIPNAVHIKRIRLLGDGWDFESWFDNITITP